MRASGKLDANRMTKRSRLQVLRIVSELSCFAVKAIFAGVRSSLSLGAWGFQQGCFPVVAELTHRSRACNTSRTISNLSASL